MIIIGLQKTFHLTYFLKLYQLMYLSYCFPIVEILSFQELLFLLEKYKLCNLLVSMQRLIKTA